MLNVSVMRINLFLMQREIISVKCLPRLYLPVFHEVAGSLVQFLSLFFYIDTPVKGFTVVYVNVEHVN